MGSPVPGTIVGYSCGLTAETTFQSRYAAIAASNAPNRYRTVRRRPAITAASTSAHSTSTIGSAGSPNPCRASRRNDVTSRNDSATIGRPRISATVTPPASTSSSPAGPDTGNANSAPTITANAMPIASASRTGCSRSVSSSVRASTDGFRTGTATT